MNATWESLLKQKPIMQTLAKTFMATGSAKQAYFMLAACLVETNKLYNIELLSIQNGLFEVWFSDEHKLSYDLATMTPTAENHGDSSIDISNLLELTLENWFIEDITDYSEAVCDSKELALNEPYGIASNIKSTSTKKDQKRKKVLSQYESTQASSSIPPTPEQDDARFLALIEKFHMLMNQHTADPRPIITLENFQSRVVKLRNPSNPDMPSAIALIKCYSAVKNFDLLKKDSAILSNLEAYKLVLLYIESCKEILVANHGWANFTSIGRTRELRRLLKEKLSQLDPDFKYIPFKADLDKSKPLFFIANYLGLYILQYPELFTASKIMKHGKILWTLFSIYLQKKPAYRQSFTLPETYDAYNDLTIEQLFIIDSYYI
ncbi:hypothetical protein K7432_012930 [Basidiobolus ranarum]|uniref:Uncharacterized protein n=1 Tax=Basidiobolus ranarum TaxID=34480 RepID=A0ABR2WK59_9FUNG